MSDRSAIAPHQFAPLRCQSSLLALAAFVVLTQSVLAEVWTFQDEVPAWARASVASEPGAATNRVLRIAATQPHHTRVELPGQPPAAFVSEARVRLQESRGAAPSAYFYGLTPDGFLALSIGSGKARLFVWRGNNAASPSFGEASAPALTGGWARVKFAFENGSAAAKVWPEGRPEPRWLLTGSASGLAIRKLAVGAWLSPRDPASATVLFDDLSVRPATAGDRIGALCAPAQPLPLAGAPAAGAFESGPFVGLAAGDLVLAFDRRDGALRHVTHRPSGRAFADPGQRRPLFTLHLTRWQSGDSTEYTADDFARVEWAAAGSHAVRATFSDGPEPGLAVEATVAAGKDGLAHFRLGVRNPGTWAVARIRYPGFASPPALGGDAADDRLLVPHSHSDGIVINAPGRQDRSAGGTYPGDAAVQMAALYDAAAGLLLATHDAEGHCKVFDVRMSRDRFVELSVTHLRPEVPGDADTPYDTVLGSFTGGWRDAADLYKRWAKSQPWCARTLDARSDVPAFLKEGAAGVIVPIANANGYTGLLGPSLEKLPDLAASYRRRARVPPLIVVPYGWENRGTWAGIHYLPAVPSDASWREANAALKAQGDRTALLTSGFWWVVRRAKTSGGPAFDDTADFERRQAMTVHRADGTPWLLDAYDKAGTAGDWRGVSAKLCHGSAEARDTLLDIFLGTAALGTPLISFDQEIGGGQSAPCYATGHGHPPGYGAWMWSGFRDLCEQIRTQARPAEPEIGLLVENCGEMIIPVMATYWSRQFGVIDSGSDGEGPVGLFSYLYHEYVTAIGAAVVQGQGPQGARGSAGLRCQALANNLARGLIPCPFNSDAPLETADARKAQIARAFFAFCEPFGTFPEFLVLGQTLHPPELACASREEWYEPKAQKGARTAERRTTRPLPAVLTGRFAAPDGRIGTVFVNATPEPQVAKLQPKVHGPATLHRADRSVETSWSALPGSLDIALEPFGVRMLVEPAPPKAGAPHP